ncbi:uncharacterized protein SETTUDRAFT_155017 [Exserohilum turcica Et28A]|uniref:DOC domain-containing protein n=1 Tax=Exserohilum turcicum (strain 28A) TaxID=671987 RepID=R0IKT8_EXST2|nr:uncharacterized protein SETTUDRAFT_155017 [Exserohilum turcica Et28A]EOA85476.1 hypothetical protein SETTUDRAFT_155017 [Exserohilum turcica Et28A]
MPPSLRRRGHSHHVSPPSDPDDSDHDVDDMERQDEPDVDDEGLDDDEEGVEDDDDDEEDVEDEEALASPSQTTPLPNLDPPPPYLREISTLASWTVSSSKPGCSIPQLRHPNTNLFWQSDGPQPHYLNIHFFKLVRIVGLRLYLDFEQDESYTPTRIIFLAGSGMNDLQEWGEMRLESPRGWVWADFSGVGDVDSDGDENSDDDDDDDNNNNQDSPHGHHQQQHQIAAPHPPPQANGTQTRGPHDASSDSENAAPFHTPSAQLDLHTPVQTRLHHHHHHHHTTTTTPLPRQPHAMPSSSFDHATPTLHPTTSTPTLPRPSSSSFPPAYPFPRPNHHNNNNTHIFTPHPPLPWHPRASPLRTRIPKMPVLRAHLVQIKILENHQNGKDTHLRGLQVFAKNDEDHAVGRVGSGAVGGTGKSGKGSGKRTRGGNW